MAFYKANEVMYRLQWLECNTHEIKELSMYFHRVINCWNSQQIYRRYRLGPKLRGCHARVDWTMLRINEVKRNPCCHRGLSESFSTTAPRTKEPQSRPRLCCEPGCSTAQECRDGGTSHQVKVKGARIRSRRLPKIVCPGLVCLACLAGRTPKQQYAGVPSPRRPSPTHTTRSYGASRPGRP